MADLKKCPFCGSDAMFRHIFENPDKCMVGCRGCDVVIDGVFPNELEAAKKWNDQVLADEIAALKADRDAWRRRAERLESRLASMTAERDALIASLRNNDKCETCMHSLSDGCSAIRNGWRCRYVHPSEEWRGPEEDKAKEEQS